MSDKGFVFTTRRGPMRVFGRHIDGQGYYRAQMGIKGKKVASMEELEGKRTVLLESITHAETCRCSICSALTGTENE